MFGVSKAASMLKKKGKKSKVTLAERIQSSMKRRGSNAGPKVTVYKEKTTQSETPLWHLEKCDEGMRSHRRGINALILHLNLLKTLERGQKWHFVTMSVSATVLIMMNAI